MPCDDHLPTCHLPTYQVLGPDGLSKMLVGLTCMGADLASSPEVTVRLVGRAKQLIAAGVMTPTQVCR